LRRRQHRETTDFQEVGAEYARLTLEDFHGTAEVIVFPEAWARLNSVIRADGAYLSSAVTFRATATRNRHRLSSTAR